MSSSLLTSVVAKVRSSFGLMKYNEITNELSAVHPFVATVKVEPPSVVVDVGSSRAVNRIFCRGCVGPQFPDKNRRIPEKQGENPEKQGKSRKTAGKLKKKE